ncbi:unnamed protein product [Candida verbasci]|uniref:AMP-activated protein kinase glycogen-binding domain-containing protein n=1 Tax=Candida verbasci TaxID=1227364 RepID=A0A9W4X9J8_9ASCO|nr:unnamed protein product [Candida verbasci]
MSVHYTFRWPEGPNDVIVTGTFDNWSKSLPLVKQGDGSFSLQVPLPPVKEHIYYKYVVDGEWEVNPNEKSTKDSEGNYNNWIEADDLKELLVMPGAIIPETGLAFINNKGGKLPENHHEFNNNHDNDLKATVLPKEEPHHVSIAGEPGIFVPQGEEQLNAFRTFEHQDAKALNEEPVEETDSHGISTQREEQPKEAKEEHQYTQGITPAAVALGEEKEHIGSNAHGEHTKEIEQQEKPEGIVESREELVRQSVSGGITPAAIALAEEHEHIGPNADGAHTKEVLEGKDEALLSPEEKKKQKKKVKRSQYKAKKKKKAADGADGAVAAVATSTEEDYTPEPEETKKDHSDAAKIGAGTLGGGALGAGLGAGFGAALASEEKEPSSTIKTLDPKASEPLATNNDQLNEGKEVDASPIGEKARETSNVVPVTGGVVGGGSNQPLVSKPSTSEPVSSTEYKDIPSQHNVVPLLPTDATATSQPVESKENKEEEEIIIATSGKKSDIVAAVEAQEGHDVTLEEITPTKSEREELTREAEIAAHARGPVSIEQVIVPKDELSTQDADVAAATAPTSQISKPKESTIAATKPKETTTTKPTEKTTTSSTPAKKQTTSTPAKKTTANGAKKEEKEKKKGGFRNFLKKLVT